MKNLWKITLKKIFFISNLEFWFNFFAKEELFYLLKRFPKLFYA